MAIFDKNLFKRAFRFIFKLQAGTYLFGTDTPTPAFVESTCKYASDWFTADGFTLTQIDSHTWIVQGVFDKNILQTKLAVYWADHQYKCQQ